MDYYFYRVSLNSTTSIADSGGVHPPIVVCLLAAWTVVAICCIRGISTSGKVCATSHFHEAFELLAVLDGISLAAHCASQPVDPHV